MADTRKDVLQTQFAALDAVPTPTPRPDIASDWPNRGYGLREDGTQKGNGYMGMIGRPNDKMKSSELSVGVRINGKDVSVPSMVPTLNKEQLNRLLSLPPEEIIKQKDIIKAATEFAQDRAKKGMPFFARVDEEGTYPVPTE